MATCPVCSATAAFNLTTANGERFFCGACFHSWRPSIDYDYSDASPMCLVGSSEGRLNAQAQFISARLKSGATVLEIGCATGELAELLQRRNAVARYDAIELSPRTAEIARRRVSTVFTTTLTEALVAGAIRPQAYDLIVMSHVLEHIADADQELRSVRTALRSDGQLFIEVPNASGNQRLPFDDNIAHVHFFSPTSLHRMLANHGMTALAVETRGWLDPRYSDSLRAIFGNFEPPQQQPTLLSDRLPAEGTDRLAVWGAGSVAQELLANFFDTSRIAFFVDANPDKHGTFCLGARVLPPRALAEEDYSGVLINSVDFAPEIQLELERLVPDLRKPVFLIEELLA
jgi:SAM-dependent methyltransferase